MKTKKNLLVGCFVGLVLTFGIAGTSVALDAPGTGIAGSRHDMTAFDSSGETRVCAYCHTPHHGNQFEGDYMPLWSRPDMGVTTFEQYDSATLDAGSGGGADLTYGDPLYGPSRLCMSCHDGVVAIDSYYGSAPAQADSTITHPSGGPNDDSYGGIAIMANQGLSNDHPIGFDYETVASLDDEIISGPTFASANAGAGVAIADVLYDDGTDQIMTCSTCHDVHNTKNPEYYFLYEMNAGSALCLTCHDK